ncbi:translation initiation factor eIF-2B subunit family protein [Aspergillus stella-maris]|uniref:translation initiation factor eIF-2B subunit family protein n=1 Tax=Aspergillus stella-maris TaxID=1810926 RepID=UPI003CCD9A63
MAGQSHPQDLERRSIVSSFIFHFPNDAPDNPRVALFNRSGEVNTYKHQIAPISGTISRSDASPLSAAWRELSEETGLNERTLAFWRSGKPFSFVDESVKREWTIYPFSFLLRDSETAITLDWEHESWEWYDPSSVLKDSNFEEKGVPRLKESLRRVYLEGEVHPDAAKVFRNGLEKLKNDHSSGSHELTGIALGIFKDFLIAMKPSMPIDPESNASEKWWERISLAVWHIVKNGRESMGAATLNALLAILEEMDEVLKLDEPPDWKMERFLTIIEHHIKGRNSRAGLVKETFATYVRKQFLQGSEKQRRERLTILTLSASSTIRDSIVQAFASLDIGTLELRVLESRPLFEGVTFASSVLENFKDICKGSPEKKLHVQIYTDASAAIASNGVDVVLLGADRISRLKGVSNKTGSLPTVLSAKHVAPNAKIVVLSELEKVNGENGIIDDEKHEDNDPAELLNTWRNDGVKLVKEIKKAFSNGNGNSNATVEVRNVYFEWIPLALVDAFVSGEGVLNDNRIHEKANQQEELATRYFDGISIRY